MAPPDAVATKRYFELAAGSRLVGRGLVNASEKCARLVPLRAGNTIAQPFADLTYHLSQGMRANTLRNMAHVLQLPESDPRVRRAARGSFRHFSRFVAESIHAQGWGTEDMADRVDIQGAEHLDAAAAEGKGVVFVSAHLGATEVAGEVAVLKGFRVTSIIEEVQPEWLMECVLLSRERMGITLLPPAGAGISLIRELRRGGLVAFAIDAGIDRPDSIPVQFFGRPTMFPEGPARLARLTGAPMVFAVGLRTGRGRYRVEISPPVHCAGDLSAEGEIARATQAVATMLEGVVRRYPAQWYAFRDMWPSEKVGGPAAPGDDLQTAAN